MSRTAGVPTVIEQDFSMHTFDYTQYVDVRLKRKHIEGLIADTARMGASLEAIRHALDGVTAGAVPIDGALPEPVAGALASIGVVAKAAAWMADVEAERIERFSARLYKALYEMDVQEEEARAARTRYREEAAEREAEYRASLPKGRRMAG